MENYTDVHPFNWINPFLTSVAGVFCLGEGFKIITVRVSVTRAQIIHGLSSKESLGINQLISFVLEWDIYSACIP